MNATPCAAAIDNPARWLVHHFVLALALGEIWTEKRRGDRGRSHPWIVKSIGVVNLVRASLG
jgi:hypothetical protein